MGGPLALSDPPYVYEGNGAACEFGACYNHSGFDFFPYGSGNLQGGFLGTTLWAPYVATTDYHSLAEIAIEGFSGGQLEDTVELGWTVDRTGVNGSDYTNPHIFVYFTNADYRDGCYNAGCGFQAYPNQYVYDGAPLPGNGTLAYFEIYHAGGNWWVYFDGQAFGYFPDGLFYDNLAGGAGDLEGYGEVATTSGTPEGDCTQMGNGVNAAYSNSATINAFEGVDANGNLETAATLATMAPATTA